MRITDHVPCFECGRWYAKNELIYWPGDTKDTVDETGRIQLPAGLPVAETIQVEEPGRGWRRIKAPKRVNRLAEPRKLRMTERLGCPAEPNGLGERHLIRRQFYDNPSILVTLVGASGAGKSHVLAALVRRLGMDNALGTIGIGTSMDQVSKKLYSKVYSPLLNREKLGASAMERDRDKLAILTFQLTFSRGGRNAKKINLIFCDSAGELQDPGENIENLRDHEQSLPFMRMADLVMVHLPVDGFVGKPYMEMGALQGGMSAHDEVVRRAIQAEEDGARAGNRPSARGESRHYLLMTKSDELPASVATVMDYEEDRLGFRQIELELDLDLREKSTLLSHPNDEHSPTSLRQEIGARIELRSELTREFLSRLPSVNLVANLLAHDPYALFFPVSATGFALAEDGHFAGFSPKGLLNPILAILLGGTDFITDSDLPWSTEAMSTDV